ncbi:Bucentaur or craniofacial development-domain containing protein [Nitzschia inconspicua]|uniref:Bucentaur or craniofacial development-domain containing protein n=1 Tax=Nitzschia inconspicua TaxID=303405 RepID=A0A9K3M1X5_9STRA|nr:Bucentaur or craniofacial development-domain containing protein [Nitzschia inconspicua]
MSKAVDEAFERLFGYKWGTELEIDDGDTLPADLVQVFGSKQKVAQILRLPSLTVQLGGVNRAPNGGPKDAAQLLSQPIVTITNTTTSGKKRRSATDGVSQRTFKRTRRLDDDDYKTIELPKIVLESLSVDKDTNVAAGTSSSASPDGVVSTTAATTATKKSSNLDVVLQQLAGPKKPNTVEKTNDDWESFKETDKTLQDDLERTAQSKNAYLVKQDFLSRVDQRRFEIEKSERDLERARRATTSGK